MLKREREREKEQQVRNSCNVQNVLVVFEILIYSESVTEKSSLTTTTSLYTVSIYIFPQAEPIRFVERKKFLKSLDPILIVKDFTKLTSRVEINIDLTRWKQETNILFFYSIFLCSYSVFFFTFIRDLYKRERIRNLKIDLIWRIGLRETSCTPSSIGRIPRERSSTIEPRT